MKFLMFDRYYFLPGEPGPLVFGLSFRFLHERAPVWFGLLIYLIWSNELGIFYSILSFSHPAVGKHRCTGWLFNKYVNIVVAGIDFRSRVQFWLSEYIGFYWLVLLCPIWLGGFIFHFKIDLECISTRQIAKKKLNQHLLWRLNMLSPT